MILKYLKFVIKDNLLNNFINFFLGCMYSMAAFGPVLGFLLGAYLLSFHMDSFSGTIISIGDSINSIRFYFIKNYKVFIK